MSDRADLGNLPSLVLLRQELVDAAAREPILRRSRLRTWLAGLCAVGAIAVSPLGAAIADELADLVGIGDPPSDTRPRDAIVIGAPATAVPFEIVAIGAEPTRDSAAGRGADPVRGSGVPQRAGRRRTELHGCRAPARPPSYRDSSRRLTVQPLSSRPTARSSFRAMPIPEVARVELVVPTPSGDQTALAEIATLSRSLSAADRPRRSRALLRGLRHPRGHFRQRGRTAGSQSRTRIVR